MSKIKYTDDSKNNRFFININTEFASYNFIISNSEPAQIIGCDVIAGGYEKSNYEFKSQAHAWMCFKEKISQFTS